jgi:hypothetical protein
MSENQVLLNQLEDLLRLKKSKKFYAERLRIREEEVNDLLKELSEQNNEPLPEVYIASTKKTTCKFSPRRFIDKPEPRVDLNTKPCSSIWASERLCSTNISIIDEAHLCHIAPRFSSHVFLGTRICALGIVLLARQCQQQPRI